MPPKITAIAARAMGREPREVKAILEMLSSRWPELKKHWTMPWLVPDAFDPNGIRESIRDRIREIAEDELVHLHYTGGTAAMAVHTLEALRDLPEGQVQVSYLNAVSHRVLPDELMLGGIDDERESWHVTLKELGRLHDVELLPVKEALDDQLVLLAQRLFQLLLVSGCWDEFRVWDQDYRKRYLRGESTRVRLNNVPAGDIAWPQLAWPEWEECTRQFAARFPVLCQEDAGWVVRPNRGTDNLPELHRFNQLVSTGVLLEMNVYAALKDALGDLGRELDDIQHSVEITRAGVPAELDVVAVVGFQLLAVSCKTTTDRKACKLAAFEALHRARQLGGDGSRAIVVCRLDATLAWQLEEDLLDDPGTVATPLRVWGADKWPNLREHFVEYLRKDLNIRR